MGNVVDVNECKLILEFGKERTWTYTDNLEPGRKVLLKENGEWLGWFPLGKRLGYKVIHGYSVPIGVRSRLWIRKKGPSGVHKWSQKADLVFPEIENFYPHCSRWKFDIPGFYKMKVEIYSKKKNITTRVTTFSIYPKDIKL